VGLALHCGTSIYFSGYLTHSYGSRTRTQHLTTSSYSSEQPFAARGVEACPAFPRLRDRLRKPDIPQAIHTPLVAPPPRPDLPTCALC